MGACLHRLLTVDVWDTMIRRLGHPDMPKVASARHLSLCVGAELPPHLRDHFEIYRERCAIEGEFATAPDNPSGEYRAEQVLGVLVSRLLPNRVGEARLAIADQLVKVEMDHDFRHSYPDPTIIEYCSKYPAETTLFLSDFYFGASFLERLIRHHGLGSLVDGGLSSCDEGCNKRSGQLFRHVHRQLLVTPAEHVHIGDNDISDHAAPARLGVKSLCYRPPAEHALRCHRESQFRDRESLFRDIFAQSKVIAEASCVGRAGSALAAFKLGMSSAPLFMGFALHTAERSLEEKCDKLLFFTREGAFFRDVWSALFPDGRIAGLDLPDCELVEVSRISTFCASLREVSIEEMMRVWNLYSTQSMFALAKTLDLDPGLIDNVVRSHGIDMHEQIQYPWADQRVRQLFGDPSFVSILQARVASARRGLLAYLSERALSPGDLRVGIVDIGWRGTIQDNLAWVRPETHFFGHYLGLQRFLNVQPSNCSKSAFGPNANESSDSVDLLDAVSVIEMLCNSTGGSVVGYQRNSEGRCTAVREVDLIEDSVVASFSQHFQDGVVAVARGWADAIDRHVIRSSELRPLGMAIWRQLASSPDAGLVSAYASLRHNECFGLGRFVSKSQVPTLGNIVRSIVSPADRRLLIEYVRQVQWPAGIKGRSDLGWLHRNVLCAVMWLALACKHARAKLFLRFSGRR